MVLALLGWFKESKSMNGQMKETAPEKISGKYF
jgi:hypothetical protein